MNNKYNYITTGILKIQNHPWPINSKVKIKKTTTTGQISDIYANNGIFICYRVILFNGTEKSFEPFQLELL